MSSEAGEADAAPPAHGRGAVFLSYASEDAAAAQKICTALRAAGIEVWFDRSELRGGDAWDAAIRRQIKSWVTRDVPGGGHDGCTARRYGRSGRKSGTWPL